MRTTLKFYALLIALVSPHAALSDTADKSVLISGSKDWSVFRAEDPLECWAVTMPSTSPTQNGAGRLHVTFRDGAGPEIFYTSGSGIDAENPVSLQVRNQTFDLVSEGAYAWASNATAASEILDQRRAGRELVIGSVSQQGMATQEVFSLMGLTEAVRAAENCGR